LIRRERFAIQFLLIVLLAESHKLPSVSFYFAGGIAQFLQPPPMLLDLAL